MIANGGLSIDLPIGDMLNLVYLSINQLLQNADQQGNFPQIETSDKIIVSKLKATQFKKWLNR